MIVYDCNLKVEMLQISKGKTMENNWKEIALYLMECHAATVENMPKSWSNREKERMRLISEMIINALNTGANPNKYANYNIPEDEKIKKTKERLEFGLKLSE